jgi:hypothetical protein
MRLTACTAIVAALLAASPRADASAWADVSFAGMHLSGQGSGTWFDATFFGRDVQPGGSYTETFPYTITLHADGEPATREWSSCLPLTITDCGPAPTGSELVEFEFGTVNTRETSPFVSYYMSGQPASLVVLADGTATYSGTLSLTETIAPFGSYFPNTDYLTIWTALWIDSADGVVSVPEPAVPGLMLAGAGMLAAIRRTRRGRALR